MSSSVPDPADLTEWLRTVLDDEQRAEDAKVSMTPPPGGARCPHDRMPVEEITYRTRGELRLLPCGHDVTDAEWRSMMIVKPAGDPRKLADIASKRVILDACTDLLDSHDGDCWDGTQLAETVVRALAQSFRGAPGWRNEWAIED